MKKFLSLLSLTLILFSPTLKAATELKLAVLAPEGSTWVKTLEAMNAELKSKSNNSLSFKIFAGGVTGDEKDVIRKMRINQLQAGAFTGVGLGQIAPAIRILELPLLFNNYAEVDYVKEKIRPQLEAALEKRGFKLLGWAEAGFVNIFSNKAIRNQKDMEGVKFWVWSGDPLAKEMTQALGIAPIPLALPDVLTSLQTGLINGVYGPPLAVLALQWFPHLKYMTKVDLANSTGALLISKRAFNQLSPANQKTLKEVVTRYSKQLVQKIRVENNQAIATLKNNGIEIVEVNGKDLAELKRISATVYPKLVGKLYSAELLQQVQGLLKQKRGQ